MERLRAPELEPSLAWLNTARPLRIRELRGHVVILDFWTSCCVNCMHVLPVLRDLERRYAGRPVQVIGVHSAKFPGEARPERVADAIARHEVEHPVVVDADMGIWERYTVRSWPTLVVLRTDGTIAAVAPGEPDPRALDALVARLLREAEAAGTLAAAPLTIDRGPAPTVGPLRFPGKLARASDGRVAIADAGHHRVLICGPDGQVVHTIGSGRRGLQDGPFAQARLDDPQGLAWDRDSLWICDARNHCILRADLASGRLTIVAGTGAMGEAPLTAAAPARTTALRSPWALACDGESVLIALAGSHQLAMLTCPPGQEPTIAPLAGGGREALVDGDARTACYAQPSGLALTGSTLLVADSETSAIRALDLRTRVTRTIVGAGLFDFGDVDGPLAAARLQHALAVAVTPDGELIVADTFNNSLRRIDLQRGQISTLTRGLRDPADVVALPDGRLLVADTGNHRVVWVAADGALLGALEIRGAPAVPPAEDGPPPPLTPAAATRWFDVPLATQPLGPGPGALALEIAAPPGWKLAAGAPLRVQLEVSRRSDLLALAHETLALTADGGPGQRVEVGLQVAPLTAPIASELLARVDAMLCRTGDDGVCAPSQAWLRLPLALTPDGPKLLRAELPLATPDV